MTSPDETHLERVMAEGRAARDRQWRRDAVCVVASVLGLLLLVATIVVLCVVGARESRYGFVCTQTYDVARSTWTTDCEPTR